MGYLESDELFPKGEDGKILLSDIDYLDTWKALEQAVVQKKVRSIGLSNFNSAQIQRVINNSEIKPAVLEVKNSHECVFMIITNTGRDPPVSTAS
jgi:aldehyde reductase